MERYAIGIDPGFFETGVVLVRMDPRTPIAWATMRCPAGGTHLARTVSLAGEIVGLINTWVESYEIEALDIAIETPIWNRNPVAYELQFRLLQEIESGLFNVVGALVRECWLTEVAPTTSKLLATGSGAAKKRDMVASMPRELRVESYNAHTLETLADAHAHSLAAWSTAGQARVNITEVVQEWVVLVCEWRSGNGRSKTTD